MPDRFLPLSRLFRRPEPRRGAASRVAHAGISPGGRVVSLILPLLMVLGALVAGLAPATASAAPTPVTAYVINNSGDAVTPVDVATNTPGAPIPTGASTRNAGSTSA